MIKQIEDRIRKGHEIAMERYDEIVLVEETGNYRVPGSTHPYYVDADTGHCTCPDRQQGQARKLDIYCKHFFAVRFVLFRPTQDMKEHIGNVSV